MHSHRFFVASTAAMVSLAATGLVAPLPAHAQSAGQAQQKSPASTPQQSTPPTPQIPPPPPPPPVPTIQLPQPLSIPAPLPSSGFATPPQPSPTGAIPLPLDIAGDSIGIAQQTAHQRGLQGRVLWIDGTANIDSINSADKIDALMAQARRTGFNTIVLDVKPIVGYTLYPSRFTRKLTDWKGVSLPITFDPLAAMITAAHAQGLQLVANMSTFGEGHKLVSLGPTFSTNPGWQTVLYEATRTITAPVIGAGAIAISDTPNEIPDVDTEVALYTNADTLSRNYREDGTVLVTNFVGRIMAVIDVQSLSSIRVSAPPEGAVLVGFGRAGVALRNQFKVGDIVQFNSAPKYVQIKDASEQKVTMFVNPNDPQVQQHELNIVEEIATNYAIDGMIFDDRMRFAAINADFSPLSRQLFEQYVGHRLNWPDDVFRINPFPNQDIIKGPEYEAWETWRALTIRNWLANARTVVKAIRPNATVSTYTGSWYGQYDQLGSNWAAPDFDAPFAFLTPAFQQTGYAGLLDWMTTGCYYSTATVAEGNAAGSPGATVEGAAQLSNRAINDQAWFYAGLYVANFSGQPDAFARCLQAATASSQGVMLFDLSQINQYNYWPIIAAAFAAPATAPHTQIGLLDQVRAQHFTQKATGLREPPVVVYGGTPGTGL